MITRIPSTLRAARTAARLSQAELARKLRTTQSAIARLEAPGSNPTVHTLERALIATGHRLEITATPALPPVDTAQIVSRLQMSPADRLVSHSVAHRNLRQLARRASRPVGSLD